MNAATKSTSLGVLSGLFAFILLSWLSPPTNTATDASRMRRLLLRLDGIAASLEDIAHAQHSVTMELTTRYPDLGKVAGTLLLGTPGLGGSPAPAPVTSAAPAAFGGAAPQPAPVSGTPQPQYSAPVVDADAAQLDQLKKELMEAERREEVVAHEQSAFESAKRFIMDADLVEIASVAIANRNDPRVGPLVRECERLKKDNNIAPFQSWGRASDDDKIKWGQIMCDVMLAPERFKDMRAPSEEKAWLEGFGTYLEEQLRNRKPVERATRQSADSRPVVGVGLGTTSRNLDSPSMDTIPLFKHMLPSVVQTADPAYEYWIYVVYDEGDAFYDSPTMLPKVVEWLQNAIERPLRERGVACQVVLLRYRNDIHKPGPVFNFVMRALYDDGADYLVRVNDDTELKNGPGRTWTKAMVDTLSAMNPPQVGVTGPTCNEGATWILTHDMVHRTHLDIFDFYYPPLFTDWWLDDWISAVYTKERTKKLEDVFVTHHAKIQRYSVVESHGKLVHKEAEKGTRRISDYLKELADGKVRITAIGQGGPRATQDPSLRGGQGAPPAQP